jgi:hypothetical protein
MAVFWIGILIAVIFAYTAIKQGFYHAWTLQFNMAVSVYIAVRVGSGLEDFVPAAVGGQYARTFALLGAWLGTFLILHGIAYVLLIGQFEVTFPRAANVLGSGILGFLAGFLIWSFGTFVFCTTPLCQNKYVKEIGLDTKTFEEAKMQSYLVGWCGFMDKFVGSSDEPPPVDKVIRELLIKPEKIAADANSRGASRPVITNEPNNTMNPVSIRSSSDSNSVIHP